MFKIKDLMIKVVSGTEAAGEQQADCMCSYCTGGDSQACTGITCFTCSMATGLVSYLCPKPAAAPCPNPCSWEPTCNVCSDWTCDTTPAGCTECTDCTEYTNQCRPGPCCASAASSKAGIDAPPSLEGLATLKAQLKQQLAMIEQHEKVLADSLSPASLEEAETLEKKLVEALDEVKTMKAKFKKQPEK